MKQEPAWRRYLHFWGPSAERDVDDEFRFHLEAKVEELRANGLGPAEARREAVRQFGPVAGARTECVEIEKTLQRRASRLEFLYGWWGDLRYSVRVLARAKGSTAAAILILAVAIGSS